MRYISLILYILIIYNGKALAGPQLKYATLLGAYSHDGAGYSMFWDMAADVDSEGNFYILAEQADPPDPAWRRYDETQVYRLLRLDHDGSGVDLVADITGPCQVRRIMCHPSGFVYIEYGTREEYLMRRIGPDGRASGGIGLPFSPDCSYIDEAGNIYIAGSVSRSEANAVPVTGNAMGAAFIGGEGDKDIFIMKYDTAFNLEYCSFLGGSGQDIPASITGGSGGGIVLSCYSLSQDCSCLPGGEYPSQAVLVFDSSLRNVVYGRRSDTAFYPSGYDTTRDPFTGSVYDVGERNSVFSFAPNGECQWVFDIAGSDVGAIYWASKSSAAAGKERLGRGIAVDNGGNVYYTMDVTDTAFPVTAGAFAPDYNGGAYDITVSRISATGKLEYATYFGGSGADQSSRRATAFKNGIFYCAGITNSPDFPTTPGAYIGQRSNSGGYDIFAFALDFNKSADIAGEAVMPTPLIFEPPRPNPFNPATTLSFTLPETSYVRLLVYNISGQLVRELMAESLTAGQHAIVWDGRDANGATVSSGVYITQLSAGGMTAVRKMVLVR